MTVPAAIVQGMAPATTLDFDLATLRRAIGGGSYVRGTEYARQQAVLRVSWDPDGHALIERARRTGTSAVQISATRFMSSLRHLHETKHRPENTYVLTGIVVWAVF